MITNTVRIENSFIPVHGIGEVTERKLWENGIHTWDDFDGSVVGETLADRINEFISTADDYLQNGDPRFFNDAFPSHAQWRMYENFGPDACFLDIETTGLSPHKDDVTVVSLQLGTDTTSLVRGMNLTRSRLREELENSKLLITYNGKQFDVPMLEREFDLDIEIPHIDLRFLCERLNYTGGLKQVEQTFDIPRSHDIDGWEAVRLWHQYQNGDVDALKKLVAYNREDTKNLKMLMEMITSDLHDEVFVTDTDSR